MELKECPHCGSDVELEKDSTIFHGQCYSNRYPPNIANQDHGYRIRCVKCGCQTCWWHYKKEAAEIWNKRHLTTKCCVLCPQSRKSGKCGIDEDLEKVDKPKKFTPPRYDVLFVRGREWLDDL